MEEDANKFDTIVIGSGIGGMASASALARCGKKVLILEQHNVAGGLTHVFKRGKFSWCVGVHNLGEMSKESMPGKLLDWLSDGKVKMNQYGFTFETFFFPEGFRYDFPNSQKEFIRRLEEYFPNEKEGIKKFTDLVDSVGNHANYFFGSRNLPKLIEKFSDTQEKRDFYKYSDSTVKEVLDDLFCDEKIKTVLSGYGAYYGSIPSRASFFIHALTIKHYWGGTYYPEGSPSTLAKYILGAVEALGGEVRLSTSVEEILFENEKMVGVKTNKGNFYAPLVISAIGARATVENLLPKSLLESPWSKTIIGLEPTSSYLGLYLGFEGDIKSAGATESNQWYCETFSFEKPVWEVEKNEGPTILYIAFPSLKDPKNQKYSENQKPIHTGHVAVYVPWDSFKKWKDTKIKRRGEEYETFKESIKERLMKVLRKRIPKVMEMCVFSELSTPLSTDHFCRPTKGAIYGLEPTPKRWRTLELRPETPYKGLYLSGVDVGTVGVVGALVGGVLTAAKIEPSILPKLREGQI